MTKRVTRMFVQLDPAGSDLVWSSGDERNIAFFSEGALSKSLQELWNYSVGLSPREEKPFPSGRYVWQTYATPSLPSINPKALDLAPLLPWSGPMLPRPQEEKDD